MKERIKQTVYVWVATATVYALYTAMDSIMYFNWDVMIIFLIMWVAYDQIKDSTE